MVTPQPRGKIVIRIIFSPSLENSRQLIRQARRTLAMLKGNVAPALRPHTVAKLVARVPEPKLKLFPKVFLPTSWKLMDRKSLDRNDWNPSWLDETSSKSILLSLPRIARASLGVQVVVISVSALKVARLSDIVIQIMRRIRCSQGQYIHNIF